MTINSADVAQSLTEDSSSATVDDAGSLTLGSNFTLTAGTFILGEGGTLSGGTTTLAGGTFTCDGGTLSGVTYDGTLDLSETDASVGLAGGTVVNNAKGTGAGTVNDTGSDSHSLFRQHADVQQCDDQSRHYVENLSTLEAYDPKGVGTVLTLGSKVTINESGDAIITDSGDAGDGIVNQGDIKQSGTKSSLDISGNSFTNSGTITAASSRAPDNRSHHVHQLRDARHLQRRRGHHRGDQFEQHRIDHARQRQFAVSGHRRHPRQIGNGEQFQRHGLH